MENRAAAAGLQRKTLDYRADAALALDWGCGGKILGHPKERCSGPSRSAPSGLGAYARPAFRRPSQKTNDAHLNFVATGELHV